MSSKILRSPDTRIEPLNWRKLTPPGARPEPAAAPPASAAPPTELQEREIARRVEEAHRRGYAEGETRGRQAASQQLQPVLDRLAKSCEDIARLSPRVRREAEEDLVRLAVAIARRILRRELTVDPEALLGLAKAALARINARELNRIRAHPEAAAWLKPKLESAGLPTRVQVLADPSLEPGAVLFETSHGLLDASVETQLGEIERGFTDLLGPSA
jgi:flagellar assembly protein FliH